MIATCIALALTGALAPGWQSVCVEIIDAAESENIPPEIALAVAYRESRLNRHAIGALGEIGPMQIRPHLHCPEGCDPITAGVAVLARYRDNADTWQAALCRYKGARAGCEAGTTRFNLALNIWARAKALQGRVWWL